MGRKKKKTFTMLGKRQNSHRFMHLFSIKFFKISRKSWKEIHQNSSSDSFWVWNYEEFFLYFLINVCIFYIYAFFTLYISFIIKKRTIESQITGFPIYSPINYRRYFPLGTNAVSHWREITPKKSRCWELKQ